MKEAVALSCTVEGCGIVGGFILIEPILFGETARLAYVFYADLPVFLQNKLITIEKLTYEIECDTIRLRFG